MCSVCALKEKSLKRLWWWWKYEDNLQLVWTVGHGLFYPASAQNGFFETNFSVIWMILLDLGSNDLKTQSAHRGLDAQASAGRWCFCCSLMWWDFPGCILVLLCKPHVLEPPFSAPVWSEGLGRNKSHRINSAGGWINEENGCETYPPLPRETSGLSMRLKHFKHTDRGWRVCLTKHIRVSPLWTAERPESSPGFLWVRAELGPGWRSLWCTGKPPSAVVDMKNYNHTSVSLQKLKLLTWSRGFLFSNSIIRFYLHCYIWQFNFNFYNFFLKTLKVLPFLMFALICFRFKS